MSYCRFSSDDFRCDVYSYEHVGGYWATHVAGNKSRGYIPRTGPFPRRPMQPAPVVVRAWYQFRIRLYVWRSRLQSFYLQHAPRRSLGLAHDGESFDDETAKDCAARLIYLRECGYRVPQYAIDTLIEESKETPDAP